MADTRNAASRFVWDDPVMPPTPEVEVEATRLYTLWRAALDALDAPDADDHDYTAEDVAHEAIVDFVEQNDLVGSDWDPRGPILECGCPKQIVDDEGHQEGCSEATS